NRLERQQKQETYINGNSRNASKSKQTSTRGFNKQETRTIKFILGAVISFFALYLMLAQGYCGVLSINSLPTDIHIAQIPKVEVAQILVQSPPLPDREPRRGCEGEGVMGGFLWALSISVSCACGWYFAYKL
ncbi:MAG: hypothetical protein AAGM40_23785, partial [Cyanobacteria bacterium J06573_2]